MVRHPQFDTVVLVVILVNVTMVVSETPDEIHQEVIFIVNSICILLYTGELFVKAVVYQKQFFKVCCTGTQNALVHRREGRREEIGVSVKIPLRTQVVAVVWFLVGVRALSLHTRDLVQGG